MEIIGPYELGPELGQGASAQVRLGTHRTTGDQVAIKIIPKTGGGLTASTSLMEVNFGARQAKSPTTSLGNQRLPPAIEREVGILKLLDHPNLLRLVDLWENRDHIYIVTEHANGGDLFQYISTEGRVSEEEAMWIFRQMMSAVDYIHALDICHRDLKCENILIHDDQIKICDFGMSALEQSPQHQLRTACGSVHYCAPELIKHNFYRGGPLDIWSMGVVLYALLVGRLPFEGDDATVQSLALRAEYKLPDYLSKEAKDMFMRIFRVQPTARITMDQMWAHPLVTKYNHLDHLHLRTLMPWNFAEARPVKKEDVDIDILHHMCAMWHMWSEVQLLNALQRTVPCQQQLFYHLMVAHKERMREGYLNNAMVSKADIHHFKPPKRALQAWQDPNVDSYCQFDRAEDDRVRVRVVANANQLDRDEVDEWIAAVGYDLPRVSDILSLGDARAASAQVTVVDDEVRSFAAPAPSFVTQRTASSLRSRRQIVSPASPVKSIRSSRGTPRPVHNPRRRGVSFTSIRNATQRAQASNYSGSLHRQGSINDGYDTDDGEDGNDDAISEPSPTRSKSVVGRRYQGPTFAAGAPREDSESLDDELQAFNKRIANDCDKAFESSIIAESEADPRFRESSPFTLSLSINSRSSTGSRHPQVPNPDSPTLDPRDPRPWINRPLPPLPPQRNKADQAEKKPQAAKRVNKPAAKPPTYSLFPKIDQANDYRRVVSADTRPPPAIYNHQVSAKRYSSLNTPATPKTSENEGLMNYGNTKTIRVVPVSPLDGALVPQPLNIRKSTTPTSASPATPTFTISNNNQNLVPAPLNLELVNEKRKVSAASKSNAEKFVSAIKNEKQQTGIKTDKTMPFNNNNQAVPAKNGYSVATMRKSSKGPKESILSGLFKRDVSEVNELIPWPEGRCYENREQVGPPVSASKKIAFQEEQAQRREEKKNKKLFKLSWFKKNKEDKADKQDKAAAQKDDKAVNKDDKAPKEEAKAIALEDNPFLTDDEKAELAKTEGKPETVTVKSQKNMRMSIIQTHSEIFAPFVPPAPPNSPVDRPATPVPGVNQSPSKSTKSGKSGKSAKSKKAKKSKRSKRKNQRKKYRWWRMRKPEIIPADFEEWEDESDYGIPEEPLPEDGTARQHWFMKLFRVKPARHYICFTMKKKHALLEITRQLRRWESMGIEDIAVLPGANRIRGRVSKENPFNAKEVSFLIEVNEVVIENTRQHLSIARVDQVSGAASSLNKLVEEMNKKFEERLMLVDDKKVAKMMIYTYKKHLAQLEEDY